MGYTTKFEGGFKFSRQLTSSEMDELATISEKDWSDDNSRPSEYADYCQWVTDKDGKYLEWDSNEKFYDYIKWLEWLIKNFFRPKGIVLDGEVEWSGEEEEDIGKIIVKNNKIDIKEGQVVYS